MIADSFSQGANRQLDKSLLEAQGLAQECHCVAGPQRSIQGQDYQPTGWREGVVEIKFTKQIILGKVLLDHSVRPLKGKK